MYFGVSRWFANAALIALPPVFPICRKCAFVVIGEHFLSAVQLF
jgi:hypothetical protein